MERNVAQAGTYEFEKYNVRNLTEKDLDAMVRIEHKNTGTSRREYYAQKLRGALNESGIRISLAAESDGILVGFLMGQVFYGEFGLPERIAVIDSVGVNPEFKGRKVGTALMHQLKMNLKALGIEKIHTEVEWQKFGLMGFFAKEGFSPAPRICLECKL
jgi:ribosomal protein S18 acetylase RimI-like enzyme